MLPAGDGDEEEKEREGREEENRMSIDHSLINKPDSASPCRLILQRACLLMMDLVIVRRSERVKIDTEKAGVGDVFFVRSSGPGGAMQLV